MKSNDYIKFRMNSNPQWWCSELEERLKFSAKLLNRLSGVGHSASLEAVAKSIRFESWHMVSNHLKKGKEHQPFNVPDTWLDQLNHAYFLLVNSPVDIKISDEFFEDHYDFAGLLASHTGLSDKPLLDNVSASLCGAKTWAELLSRDPLKTVSPLFGFTTEYDEGGEFRVSEACQQLIEQLDDLYPDPYTQLDTQETKSNRYAWSTKVLADQPTFYPAMLDVSQYLFDYGDFDASNSTITKAIESAEALIPAGFKRKIPWYSLNNRFYHRMLWLQMESRHAIKDFRRALVSARKQLRLNPNDNLGVRYVIPLLLLQDGQYEKAIKFADTKLADEGALSSLILAFCCFAYGERAGFVSYLIRTLIHEPEFKRVLLNDDKVLLPGDDGSRGLSSDLESYHNFIWFAYNSVPKLRNAAASICKSEHYIRAERELFNYWKGFWRRGDDGVGDLDGWYKLQAHWQVELERVLI